MTLHTPSGEPLSVPPGAQPRTRAGTAPHAQPGTPAGFRQARANCGSCGEAWFGEVAYCPYCGRPAASAPATALDPPGEAGSDRSGGRTHGPASIRSSSGTLRARAMRPFGATAGAAAGQRGPGWKSWAKPIVLGAVVGALVIVVGEFALRAIDSPGSPGVVRAPGGDAPPGGTSDARARGATRAPVAPAPATPAVTTAPAAPRAGIATPAQQPAPAPAARNRSLCSAANEAAGLCNPQ